MLVLTRKIGESIRIGDQIKITIMEVEGRTIKIAIDAPRSVAIHREEVYHKILGENQVAAASGNHDLGAVASLLRQPKID